MDWFEFEEIEAVATEPTRERELVPEGEYTMTIERASSTPGEYKVALAHDDRRFSWVWATMPTDKTWGQRQIVGLAKALGYEAAPWKAAAPEDLIGRRVLVQIYHKLGNTGRTFVNVRSFSQATEAAPPSAQVAAPAWKRARTADQKVKAETRAAGDDIPF